MKEARASLLLSVIAVLISGLSFVFNTPQVARLFFKPDVSLVRVDGPGEDMTRFFVRNTGSATARGIEVLFLVSDESRLDISPRDRAITLVQDETPTGFTGVSGQRLQVEDLAPGESVLFLVQGGQRQFQIVNTVSPSEARPAIIVPDVGYALARSGRVTIEPTLTYNSEAPP